MNPKLSISSLLMIIITGIFISSCVKDKPNIPPTFLSVNNDTIYLPPASGEDSFLIKANLAWTINGSADWLTISPITGDGENLIHVKYDTNTTTNLRKASFIIKAENINSTEGPITITIIQEQPDVKITGFSPQGQGGEIVTISGSGFSPILSENIVTINAVKAVVNNANPNLLTVTVPSKVGSGKIKVTVNTKSAESAYDFIYTWVGTVSTLVGGDNIFRHPAGLDIDANGNLYVADYANYKVEKVTPDGKVTVLPGRYPNPSGPDADFSLPSDVAVDKAGNVYVVEFNNHAITKISASGEVKLLAGGNVNPGYADGAGSMALFYYPTGIEVDDSGNLFIADKSNHRIRKIVQEETVSTLAGNSSGYADGTGANANFNWPFNIVSDQSGNFLVTDYLNNRIRKFTPSGIVTTFAGSGSIGYSDGTLETADIYRPTDIAVDENGNVYVVDGNAKIRWITPDGNVRTINTDVDFSHLEGVAVDKAGVVYVSDYYNNRICKIIIQ